MTVNTVTGTTATTGTTTGTNPTNSITSAQDLNDRFLKLLVAQMNNQDPLNPMDNSEVTSQMAQISMVTGLNGLDTTVNQLLTQFASLQSMQAAQLTGRTVLVPGNTMTQASDGSYVGGVTLDSGADTVTVDIKDASGNLVRELQLGQQDGGVVPFSWDGLTTTGATAPAGTYTFSVSATSSGSKVNTTTLMAGQVQGVRQNNGTLELILAGGQTVNYSDVQQIL